MSKNASPPPLNDSSDNLHTHLASIGETIENSNQNFLIARSKGIRNFIVSAILSTGAILTGITLAPAYKQDSGGTIKIGAQSNPSSFMAGIGINTRKLRLLAQTFYNQLINMGGAQGVLPAIYASYRKDPRNTRK